MSLQVRDLGVSRRFYADALAFEVAPSPNPGAVVFKDGAGAIFAVRKPLFDLESVPRLGAGVSVWFGVRDADAAFERAVNGGARVVSPPADGPFGRMFVVTDPDGYALTLHQTA